MFTFYSQVAKLFDSPSGMSEVVMLDMKGHMVVLGTALGTLMVPGYWSLQMG